MTARFSLGAKSLAELDPVHPRLRSVIKRAILITTQDFMVLQGQRTEAQAKANLLKGVSRTTNSLHLRQADGLVHAVDLAAWTCKVDWTEALYWPIATAVRQAAIDLLTPIRWGGVWDRPLGTLGPDTASECHAYAKRHPGSDLLDLGHFELPRGADLSAAKA